MHATARATLALLGAIVITAGCASTQRLSIRTEPVGAQVALQRRGEVEVQASVAGVQGALGAFTFEEEFLSLGTSPVEYEFERRMRDVDVQGRYGGGRITRHYREGMIRVEMEGYEVEERLVRFSGRTIRLTIVLRPKPPG